MNKKNPITIDGSIGEGGGQILRTTLALSAVLNKPVKIINIRAKRKNPGLQRQHLTSVMALAKISNAHVKGANLGSTELEFWPQGLKSGEYEFDIGTAGSVTLVFQALMPTMAFLPGPTIITVKGGTDVPWSPTIDYLRKVVTWFLTKMGLNVEVELHRRGHYPKGGGKVTFRINQPPGKLRSIVLLNRGEINSIEGISHAYNLPRHVAERQAKSAERILREGLEPRIPIKISVEHAPRGGLGPGSGITLWTYTRETVIGADALGARGKPAEKVGEEAAVTLLEDLKTNAALDRHMSDMIIPLTALAEGRSQVTGSRLTMHALTNIEVVKKLVEGLEISVEGDPGKPFKLNVRGVSPRYFGI